MKYSHVALEPSPLRVGFHYKLQCYIRAGRVHPSQFEGWTTFAQIFQWRPDNARFAIAQMLPLKMSGDLTTTVSKQPEGDYLVWDLFDDDLVSGRKLREKGYLPTPVPIWTHASLDGLIMKAMALYEKT